GLSPSQQETAAVVTPEVAKQTAAAGVQGLTTAAGTTGGTLASPVTGPGGPRGGAGVGSYYGPRLSQGLGLGPGQREGILPRTFEDYVSLLAPMAMETPAVVRGLARWSRGGRALTAADEQERIALGEYLKGFDADTAAYNQDIRNVDAMGRAVLDRARM